MGERGRDSIGMWVPTLSCLNSSKLSCTQTPNTPDESQEQQPAWPGVRGDENGSPANLEAYRLPHPNVGDLFYSCTYSTNKSFRSCESLRKTE